MAEGVVLNRLPVLVTVGLIWNRSGQLLLTQRSETAESFVDHWEFPGGKVESGEMPEEALIRELKEEIDLTVSSPLPWRFVTHRYTRKDILLLAYHCLQWQGAPTPSDPQVQRCRWTEVSELPGLQFPTANASLIEALVQGERP